MPLKRLFAKVAFSVLTVVLLPAISLAQTTILNVSYNVSRELYEGMNPAFITDWKAKTGETVAVNQSHGDSSKQALSVTAGLEADVVTMNQAPDVDILFERAGYVAADWRKRFPHGATPNTTTTVFLVRKDNPKSIKDWDDLTSRVPAIKTFTVEDQLGGWVRVQAKHFTDGAIYDQIIVKR